MSETEEKKPTKEECEAAGGTWNEETETCKMPEASAEATEAKAKKLDFSLTQRIENVIKDVLDTKLAALEKAIDVKIDNILKSKEIEMEQALRKGFGLDNDPVIHQSDLVAAIRKASLETKDTDKRTPAPEAKIKSTGPDGTEPKNPFEEQLKPFTQEEKK